jgi:hypothetical protein
MTGIVTEKHVCIHYETQTKTYVVVARNDLQEDWIVVSERIWRRTFVEGWRKPLEDCQIEYGPNITIKLKSVHRMMSSPAIPHRRCPPDEPTE